MKKKLLNNTSWKSNDPKNSLETMKLIKEFNRHNISVPTKSSLIPSYKIPSYKTTLKEVISVDKNLELMDALNKKLIAVKKKNARRKLALKNLQKAYDLLSEKYNSSTDRVQSLTRKNNILIQMQKPWWKRIF